MKFDEGFLARMREATRILQTEGPMAATAAIQRALHGEAAPAETDGHAAAPRPLPPMPELRDINPPQGPGQDATGQPEGARRAWHRPFPGNWSGAMPAQAIEDVEVRETADLAGKGRYIAGSCTNHAGTRTYKLYIPSGYTGQPLPLVVMLHGCTQHSDDFAAGTGMNAIAEEQNCFVVYPAETKSANASNCWNWFNAADQRRNAGEASIIADITRTIMREYGIDQQRVYAAGFSAGGAMAAVMGATYPDLYAAIGIHSGVPYAVAHDMPSAFAAMKNRRIKASPRKTGCKPPTPFGHTMPVIVFHGDRDATVDPSNADLALGQCVPEAIIQRTGEGRVSVEEGSVAGGRKYTRTVFGERNGCAVAEAWVVHGAGHAWSGGTSRGSYTDPRGPDAAREMLRFFYTRTKPAA